MKRYCMFAIIVALISSGCSYYKIKDKIKPSANFDKYHSIYVGYLDLGKEKWAIYRYSEKKEWLNLIKRVNHSALPSYFKEVFNNKTILSAKNPDDRPPKDCLIIEFRNVNYLYLTSEMFLTINIIDGTTLQKLAKYSISIDATRGGGWSWSFEDRIFNSVRNIAYFVKEKIFK